jgi:hypothetical protein
MRNSRDAVAGRSALLLVANDDNHTEAVLRIFRLYRAAKAPIEVHVFAKGTYAFNRGARSRLAAIKNWPQRLADWMGDNNLLDPAVSARNVK